ncbi:MAG: sugar ABC transporter substrate-binding protein [Lentisphaerae bacterium]|nr:sugar ABC transporter substrate-binding protein [Lentisphaerota bacterium]
MMKTTGALAIVALVLATAGCGDSKSSSQQQIIGFSVYDMKYEFFQMMEKGTRERAKELGYGYQLHDQKSDELQMVSGCKSLINQGAAALIVSPIKPDALGAVVDAAQKAEIPVVINDIGGGGTPYHAIIISDNFGGGKLAGQYVVDKLGVGNGRNVAILKCEPSAIYAIRRGEGFKALMTSNGYTVVAELSAHSKTEEGYAKMKNVLAGTPDLVAVFCENDPMAVGAAQAVAEAGKTAQVLVIGFNADGVAIESIRAGTMAATVAQFPEQMGRISAELTDKLLKKQPLQFDDVSQREIFAPVKLITQENLSEASK